MAVNGHAPGKGMQFTPTHEAKWTDDFNQLLEEYNRTHKYSRNRLTEKCIELGVQVLKQGVENPNETLGKGIVIPIEGLSDEHLNFLNSQEGRKTLSGIVKMLLIGGAPLQYVNEQPISNTVQENNIATLDTIEQNESLSKLQSSKKEEKDPEEDKKEERNPEEAKKQLLGFFDKLDKLGGHLNSSPN